MEENKLIYKMTKIESYFNAAPMYNSAETRHYCNK